MPRTYTEQFYEINTWGGTARFSQISPVKLELHDAGDDGSISTVGAGGALSTIDKIDGGPITEISVGDTVTVNVGGSIQTITGVSFTYQDKTTGQTKHAFTPNDGAVLEDAVFISASPFNGPTSTSVPVRSLIPPCFTPGTLIVTPAGERCVEDLKVGDRVITRDNGIQKICWVGRRDLKGVELAQTPKLCPILIRQGALGNNLPEWDIVVSPNHRVMISSEKSVLYFEDREVLVAAKHLVDLDGVERVEPNGVSYIHFMFEHHELVLSHGLWTESFQPGEQSIQGLDDAQRGELFELFPELETEQGQRSYGAARRSLRKFEAQVLLDNVAS